MANDYKNTMNLPKTDFPMRAGLAKSEPVRLEKWNAMDIYEMVLEKNKDNEPFVLHDGPPYANGPIHIGHAFNKTLKDIILKYKSQRGYYTPYTPGWDCHGQPIEHNVEEMLGPEKMAKIDKATLRRLCRDYAGKYVDIQREGFKRLGVRGDWDNPYLTFLPEYEAGNVEIFKKMYLDGSIYRGRKPIHWCKHCHTALAEAEIEYGDETSPSIYVKFAMETLPGQLMGFDGPTYIVIWTTTPWTLPANVAVTLAPKATYVAVEREGQRLVLAESLVEQLFETAGWEDEPVLATGTDGEPIRLSGEEFVGYTYTTPIMHSVTGTMIVGDHVTLDTGTGAVHTAPGHGQDDYLVCLRYDLPMLMPVDDDGVFTEGGGPFAGLSVDDANPKIIEWLDEHGMLVASVEITHSYPHCWRCHQPVIFRATDQWFVSMDATRLREKTLAEVDRVQWIPEWAINRFRAMVGDRPDWCISRQRSWGVPIPVFKCRKCGSTVATEATFDAVIGLFETEGADAWFIRDPSEYLPADTKCDVCGCTEVVPESDILDVWWESGISHTSVCEKNPRLHRPAEMYLEGSDQHRGWFQSSMLTSVGAYGIAPYKSVLSCGFTVDENGEKMSKSKGNGIDPADITGESGADVLRLWVASADSSHDVSISKDIIKRTADAYRHIRNTFRYLLSNLYDFNWDRDLVGFEEMPIVDQWAMARLSALRDDVTEAYDAYRFHVVNRLVTDYTSELSNFYLDMLKDRLYSDAPKSVGRRSAQTVLANILEVLVRVWGPILTFTCDEVWDNYPEGIRSSYEEFYPSMQLAGWPGRDDMRPAIALDDRSDLLAFFDTVLEVREAVTKALEDARKAGVINKSQEAVVAITGDAGQTEKLARFAQGDLEEMFIVSSVTFDTGDRLAVSVTAAEAAKCPRCWNHRELAEDGLCGRCHEVIARSEGPDGE